MERIESELRRGESESSGDDDSDDRSGVVGGGIMPAGSARKEQLGKSEQLSQKSKIESTRILVLMVEFGSPITSTLFRVFSLFLLFLSPFASFVDRSCSKMLCESFQTFITSL